MQSSTGSNILVNDLAKINFTKLEVLVVGHFKKMGNYWLVIQETQIG
jgi:hypothetical protein